MAKTAQPSPDFTAVGSSLSGTRVMDDVRRSKRLSFWLRHAPHKASLTLDESGWAPTTGVLNALSLAELPTSLGELEAIVATSDKQRFELTPEKDRIRARQGHSVSIKGDWPIASPPDRLYNGTAPQFVGAILREGLVRGRRHHVHLSSTIDTAAAVGRRRGAPVVLEVAARKMAEDEFVFRLSSNGVWPTEHVPPRYLRQLT